MIIIGAAIGGVTNSLAIKMLFRPYNPIYIGKWKLPFTPGLIPKRRGELAEQLGNLVVEHLVTPVSIEKKLLNPAFQKEMSDWAVENYRMWMKSETNVEQLFKILHIERPKEKVKQLIENKVESSYHSLKLKYMTNSLQEMLPDEWKERIDEKFPDITEYVLQKIDDYFSSPEGKAKIKTMIDDFLNEKGMLGSMIKMFIGNGSVVDKVQPEIKKFLSNSGTKEMLTILMRKEWNKLSKASLEGLLSEIPDEKIMSMVTEKITHELNLDTLLKKPIREWLEPFHSKITGELIPRCTAYIGEYLSKRVKGVIDKLQVKEMVKSEVETFSTERLEELILGISKREFKMITYLGALLGGIIGLFQGIIVMLMQS